MDSCYRHLFAIAAVLGCENLQQSLPAVVQLSTDCFVHDSATVDGFYVLCNIQKLYTVMHHFRDEFSHAINWIGSDSDN